MSIGRLNGCSRQVPRNGGGSFGLGMMKKTPERGGELGGIHPGLLRKVEEGTSSSR